MAELGITGPGSDALGVRPGTMLLAVGMLLASLFGTLSAIIVIEMACYLLKFMCYCFSLILCLVVLCQEQYISTLFKNI